MSHPKSNVTQKPHEQMVLPDIPKKVIEQHRRNKMEQQRLSILQFNELQQTVKTWYEQRKLVIDLLSFMIESLNGLHRKASIVKVGGSAGSIVGSTLAVGGLVVAPFTGGLSLVATGVGVGLVGAGSATSIGATVTEWSQTRKEAKRIQEQIDKDTALINEIIEKTRKLQEVDSNWDSRVINFEDSSNTVMSLVLALTRGEGTEDLTKSNTSKAEYVAKGAMMVGMFLVPRVIKVPIDLVILTDDVKRIHKKEPSKLSERIEPILKEYKEQTLRAIGKSTVE
jgi:hypothetical protein